jgi:hypothetical protein
MNSIGATESDTTRVCKRFLINQKTISMVENTGKELLVDCPSYSTLDKTGFYSSNVAFHDGQKKLTAKVLVRDQLSQFTARKGNEVLCMELLLKGTARKHGLYSRHDLGLNKWGTGNGCKDTHEPVDPNPNKELEVKKKTKTYMHTHAYTHTHTIPHTYTRLHTCAYREATHVVKSVVTLQNKKYTHTHTHTYTHVQELKVLILDAYESYLGPSQDKLVDQWKRDETTLRAAAAAAAAAAADTASGDGGSGGGDDGDVGGDDGGAGGDDGGAGGVGGAPLMQPLPSQLPPDNSG